ncbi:MAG TPA: hypothetical protein ACFYDZ_01955 [Candidatus Brocadiaceae bacterium]
MKILRNVFLIIPAVFVPEMLLASSLLANKDGTNTALRAEIIQKPQQLRIPFIENQEQAKGSQ